MKKIFEDLSEEFLVEVIERTNAECYITFSDWPELELHEEGGILFTMTDIPLPFFNAVLFTRMHPEDMVDRVESVLLMAKERKVPIVWFITPLSQPLDLSSYLTTKGFILSSEVGMVADLEQLGEPVKRPDDLSIKVIRDVEAFKTWCDILTDVFEIPLFAAGPWFELYSSIGFLGPWRHYMAFLEDEPAGISSLLLGSTATAIENVATLPGYRGRGIGAVLVRKALEDSRRQGYRIATMLASRMGERVYRRLGFQEVCRIGMYIWTEEQEG